MKVKIDLITVTTHDLADGDLVYHYGAVFKLKNRKVWPMDRDDNPETQGDCITFDSDLVVPASDASEAMFGRTKGWEFQGNKMAIWSKVVGGL